VKQLSRDHSVVTLTVYAVGLGVILSSPFAIAVWRWPTSAELPVLLGVGAASLVTLLCYTRGMHLGEAVVLAPIDYTRLIALAVVGLMLFREEPTLWLLAGAALIVVANLMLTFWKSREQPPSSREV
jgi:drug/metabolite transporter (DMT)-like permease